MSPQAACGCLLLAALAAGTLSDVSKTRPPFMAGGYRVLAADFHVHTFPWSASTIAPWDVVLEARRQGLDALAISGHNEVVTGKMGRWFSRLAGGPTVLASEEIHGPRFHMIAVGIHSTISWRLSAAAAIDEVHRQGGVAIAAHPVAEAWPAFDAGAMPKLDATEVVQPIVYGGEQRRRELEEFYARGRLTAIGSSDYHGVGPLGLCRTYVFAREDSEQGILEALRAGRTVVFDRGRVYGDRALIGLVREERLRGPEGSGWLAAFSRVCGVLGLIGAIGLGFRAMQEVATEPGS
jgi:hypothetical protein